MSRRLKSTVLVLTGILLVGNLLSSLWYFRSSDLLLWSGDSLVRFLVFLFAGAYVLEFAWDLDEYRPEEGFLSYDNVRDASLYACFIVSALFFYIGIKRVFHEDLMSYLDGVLYWGVVALLLVAGYHLLRDFSRTTSALVDGSRDNPFAWVLGGMVDWIYWGKDRVDGFLGVPETLTAARSADGDEGPSRALQLFSDEGFLPTLEDGKDIRVIFGGILRALGGLLVVAGVLFVLGFLTSVVNYLGVLLDSEFIIDPFFGVGLGLIQGIVIAYGFGLFAYALGKTFILRGNRLFGIQTSRYEVLPTIGEVVTYLVEYLKLLGECLFLSGIASLLLFSVWAGFEFLYAVLNLVFFVRILPFVPVEEFLENLLQYQLTAGVGYLGHLRFVVYGLLGGVGAVTVGFLARVFYYVMAEFIHGMMNVTDSVWAFLVRMEWGRWITSGEERQ